MKFQPRGIIPALVTPLRDDETVDEPALRAVIDHVIAGGVHGIFAVGSQGEFFALDLAEREKVAAIAIDAARGRVPVYVGTGAVTTRECVQLTRRAAEQGAAAVSILTPYFIKPTQQELITHYRTIADAADVPILLYNCPARTGVSIDAATARALAAVPNIVGVKDSSGSLIQTEEYILATRDLDFHVLAGNDALIAATLIMGGKGSIAATANVAPSIVAGIYEAVQAGDFARARDLQYRLFPLRKAFELGTFPIVVKEAMNLIGVPAGPARSPVGPISADMRERLRAILVEMGLIPVAV
jgi:4-hydroxy-tetrahydrodipicolinate synthase